MVYDISDSLAWECTAGLVFGFLKIPYSYSMHGFRWALVCTQAVLFLLVRDVLLSHRSAKIFLIARKRWLGLETLKKQIIWLNLHGPDNDILSSTCVYPDSDRSL